MLMDKTIHYEEVQNEKDKASDNQKSRHIRNTRPYIWSTTHLSD